jgi:hypothetical protein
MMQPAFDKKLLLSWHALTCPHCNACSKPVDATSLSSTLQSGANAMSSFIHEEIAYATAIALSCGEALFHMWNEASPQVIGSAVAYAISS